MLLDEAMPRWHRREIHRIGADLPADVLFAAVEELTWSEVPVFRALMGIRGFGSGLGRDAPVFRWFEQEGFRQVGRTDDELLIVAVERVVRGASRPGPLTIETFRGDTDPGHVKIAFNFTCAHGYLTTETRVLSTDRRSRRRFAAYWLVIRLFSGVIRRVWLRAIRTRARTAQMT